MFKLSQPDNFPLAVNTPNQFSPEERDTIYAQMHQLDYSTFKRDGLQLVWRHDDATFCMKNLDVDNALDPLGGYLKILRNINPVFEFGAGLIPLPAAATANLSDPDLHKRVWDSMAGIGKNNQTQGFMRIDSSNRLDAVKRIRGHFDAAFASLGLGERPQPGSIIDVSRELAPRFAARLICDWTGMSLDRAEPLQLQSDGQSGLLGQRFYWKDRKIQAAAVGSLNSLFADAKNEVAGALHEQENTKLDNPAHPLAQRLLKTGLSPEIVVSILANCRAAGVFTMSYSMSNAVYRIAKQPEVFRSLESPTITQRLGSQALLIDPGLSAWRRLVANSKVKLPSGTVLQKGGVLVLTAAANHDPAYFRHQNGLLRSGSHGLEFGPKTGEHRCPGEIIARLAQIACLQGIRQRVENVELQEPRTIYPSRPDLLFTGTDTRLKVIN